VAHVRIEHWPEQALPLPPLFPSRRAALRDRDLLSSKAIPPTARSAFPTTSFCAKFARRTHGNRSPVVGFVSSWVVPLPPGRTWDEELAEATLDARYAASLRRHGRHPT
jgi:hypothetical protein